MQIMHPKEKVFSDGESVSQTITDSDCYSIKISNTNMMAKRMLKACYVYSSHIAMYTNYHAQYCNEWISSSRHLFTS